MCLFDIQLEILRLCVSVYTYIYEGGVRHNVRVRNINVEAISTQKVYKAMDLITPARERL